MRCRDKSHYVVSGHEFNRRPRSRYPSVLQDDPMMSIAKNKVRVLLSEQEAHALILVQVLRR